MSADARPRLAMFSAAGCGGCEVVLLNLGERLLELEPWFEIVFAPMLADFKVAALAAMPDAGIDLCLFNGTIRTPADEEMAHLLRRKSRFLVALGACAESGGVPALANLRPTDDLLDRVAAAGTDTTDTPGPRPASAGPHWASLPALCPSATSLEQVDLVDYAIPGCPPEPEPLWTAIEALRGVVTGASETPPPGATLGVSAVALCDQCPLPRRNVKASRFRRLHEHPAEPDLCLLEQGFLCLGPATRGACGALCPAAGVPCSGCYGQPDGVSDQGARMVSALAATLDGGSQRDALAEVTERTTEAMADVVDPIGSFYAFTLQRSLLARRRPDRLSTAVGNDHESHHD